MKLKSFEIEKTNRKILLVKRKVIQVQFFYIRYIDIFYYSDRFELKKVLDDVIMSKGHATVGQYPILHDLKVLKIMIGKIGA